MKQNIQVPNKIKLYFHKKICITRKMKIFLSNDEKKTSKKYIMWVFYFLTAMAPSSGSA